MITDKSTKVKYCLCSRDYNGQIQASLDKIVLHLTVRIDRFTNFMHTILTKVVPENLKACQRFVRRSNN